MMAIATLAAVMSFALNAGVCIAQKPHEVMIVHRLARHGCNRRLALVFKSPDLSKARACLLATAARDYVGAGGARALGIQPTDTAKIHEVAVISTTTQYPDGQPGMLLRSVTLNIRGAAAALSVTIDRSTGAMNAKLSERASNPP
jgi:hypothetical protein